LHKLKTHLTRTQSRSSQRKIRGATLKNGAPQQRQHGCRADSSWGLAAYSCLIVRLRRRHGAPSLLQEGSHVTVPVVAGTIPGIRRCCVACFRARCSICVPAKRERYVTKGPAGWTFARPSSTYTTLLTVLVASSKSPVQVSKCLRAKMQSPRSDHGASAMSSLGLMDRMPAL
jgi:hypothetical protein